MSRIQEAKDIPAVNVIDPPGIPEKKSFPPRTVLSLAFTFAGFCSACVLVLFRHRYLQLDPFDKRRAFARELAADLAVSRRRAASYLRGPR